MSCQGLHAILVLAIAFEVPNRLNATWIHVTSKMPIIKNGYQIAVTLRNVNKI